MPQSKQTPLTSQEIAAAADLLAKLEPGWLPFDIFNEVARLVVMSVVEVVPLRIHSGKLQVLLIKRPANDVFWPNTWHTPGTVVRADDGGHSFEGTFNRLVREELDSVAQAGKPHYVQSYLRKSLRGMENTRVFFVEISDEPTHGTFYDLGAFPEPFLTSQLDFILPAAELFRTHKQQTARRKLWLFKQKQPRDSLLPT